MEKFKQFFNKYLKNNICLCIILAFVLNFAIEAMARQSLLGGADYLMQTPVVFFYNTLIIFSTLSISLLIKRRIFTYFIISGLWLALGIVNGVILSNRMTPFTTKDLEILDDGLTIVTNYLKTWQIVLIAIGAVLLIAGIILVFIFAPKKEKINYKKNTAIFAAVIAILAASTGAAIKTGIVDTFFGNLAYAYRDYGVPYCFINTWLNTGVGKPSGYSEEMMLGIFDEGELTDAVYADAAENDDGEIHPNIIFLQLESFIDPSLINSIELSEEATPYWNELQEKYSTGWFTVPSVGAGTANTEFEVICGMSVKFFGPGEYPYKSILSEKTCESYAYDLKSIGYSAHAIHNHRGVFYMRNKVFSNLGFDTFTSLEYMSNVIKTPKNWAKDNVLVGEILAALDLTENEDYIYTISVQGHGKYPSEQVIENPAITVLSAPTEELKWQYEYYVNQIYEMDKFVKNLTAELEKRDEKTVLVMYGDHLPALDMTEEELTSGDLYKTEYIIWSNFKMEKEDKDLFAYQIGAEVLERLGIDTGTMAKYHQNHKDSPTYLEDLRALEYDMLYGQGYIYGGKHPFEATDLKMGIRDIKITGIVEIGGKFYVKGENFTEQSRISLDGEVLETIYLGPTVLGLLEDVDPAEAVNMKVSQVDRNSPTDILSTTE
ncbi:MAG: arylsulfatase [Eubacteriales Family XIII. Incertae Sedis bacterium]|nr:MAG: arylsulfatase [Clostridiales Family XIII bacterium]